MSKHVHKTCSHNMVKSSFIPNCQAQLQLQPQLGWRLRWPYSWLLQPPNQPDSLYQTRFQINYEKKLIMNHQKRGKPNWTLTCTWHNFSHSLFLSLLSIMNNSTAALHIPHNPFPHLEQMSRSCFFHDSLVYLRHQTWQRFIAKLNSDLKLQL